MISRNVMGWPIVMATLYKQGSKEGQIHHMKALARLCSTPEEDIFSPKVKDKTVFRNPVHFQFFFPLLIHNYMVCSDIWCKYRN